MDKSGNGLTDDAIDDERVRDHLANERTFLAWTRTGIATISFGVVIARLRYLFPPSTLAPPSPGILHAADIGLIFTGVGLLTVVLAAWRFAVVREQIRRRHYRSSAAYLYVFAGVVILLGLLIIWYLLESARSH